MIDRPDEEIARAAEHLFEAGCGAHRSGDQHTAQVFLGIAQRLFEEIEDKRGAELAKYWFDTSKQDKKRGAVA